MPGHSKRVTTKSIHVPADTKHGKILAGIGNKNKVEGKPDDDFNRDAGIENAVAKVKSASLPADNILIDKSIFEMQAEICKTLSSPKRIEILNILKNEEKTVTELVNGLGASKATVSQHLAVMRHRGVLPTRRDVVNIYYRVTNPMIIDACMLMKEVLLAGMPKIRQAQH